MDAVRGEMMQCELGILTVKGCLGDDGQESESGELCLGAEAHSYQHKAQQDERVKNNYSSSNSLRLVRRRKLWRSS